MQYKITKETTHNATPKYAGIFTVTEHEAHQIAKSILGQSSDKTMEVLVDRVDTNTYIYNMWNDDEDYTVTLELSKEGDTTKHLTMNMLLPEVKPAIDRVDNFIVETFKKELSEYSEARAAIEESTKDLIAAGAYNKDIERAFVKAKQGLERKMRSL